MRHLFAGLAVVLALAGCETGSSSNDSAPSSVVSDSTSTKLDLSDPGVPLVYPGPPVTLGTPYREGVLRIDTESLCITVAEASGAAWVLAVPEGSTVDLSDPINPTLVMEGCSPMHDGDRVEFGGGRSSFDHLDPDYLQRCDATEVAPWLAGYCVGVSE